MWTTGPTAGGVRTANLARTSPSEFLTRQVLRTGTRNSLTLPPVMNTPAPCSKTRQMPGAGGGKEKVRWETAVQATGPSAPCWSTADIYGLTFRCRNGTVAASQPTVRCCAGEGTVSPLWVTGLPSGRAATTPRNRPMIPMTAQLIGIPPSARWR